MDSDVIFKYLAHIYVNIYLKSASEGVEGLCTVRGTPKDTNTCTHDAELHKNKKMR